MLKPKQPLKWIAVTLLVIVLAVWLGTQAAHRYYESNAPKRASRQIILTRAVLQKMGTLAVGDTLPAFYFQDLAGNAVFLPDVVHRKTLIFVFQPDCAMCVDELDMIEKLAPDSVISPGIVMISASNPFSLIDAQREWNINQPVLYDHQGAYISHFAISVYPFNIIVDSNLCIEELLVGKISESTLLDIVSYNQKK